MEYKFEMIMNKSSCVSKVDITQWDESAAKTSGTHFGTEGATDPENYWKVVWKRL